MRNQFILHLLLLGVCLVLSSARAEDETPFTRLFDTGLASPGPLPEESLARQIGWRAVPEDKVDHQFSGDAVLSNDKLTVVVRKQGRGAEVYSKAVSGWKRRTTLGHLRTSSSVIDPLDTLKIVENTSGAVMVEASFKNNGSGALRLRITTGEAILEIRPDPAAGFVNVQSQARYVIVPDYFGDDMVFGVEDFHGLALPAENFCLHLIDGGDAIVMNVWQSSEQDAWIDAAGTGKEGDLCSSRIRCLKGKSIWLAFLESSGLWHAGQVSVKKDWKPPFPAKWRSSLVRENGVADSWDNERGPSPEQIAGTHRGPLIVYPIDRSSATPLTASCPTDVMRNTLGVGPCQYILACEGLGSQGDPTPNSVMNWVEKQFEQKKEKKAADDIKERLEQMAEHVAHARSRIDHYAEFAGQVRKRLRQPAHPLQSIVDDLDRFVAAGLTPAASPDRARQLASDVSALIGQQNVLATCRRLGEELRSIGAVQDSALAKCRMAVRRLRQQGRTIVASQSAEAGLAQEIQGLAEQTLREKPLTSPSL